MAKQILGCKHHYEIFDLPPFTHVTSASLRRTWMQLSRKTHPDKSKARGAEAAIKVLNEAYKILTGDDETYASMPLGRGT